MIAHVELKILILIQFSFLEFEFCMPFRIERLFVVQKRKY